MNSWLTNIACIVLACDFFFQTKLGTKFSSPKISFESAAKIADFVVVNADNNDAVIVAADFVPASTSDTSYSAICMKPPVASVFVQIFLPRPPPGR